MSGSVSPQQAWATQLTDNSDTAKEQVGITRWEIHPTYGLRGYRYVQAAADTTVANGTCLAFSDKYKLVATSDVSDADQNQPAGVGIGAITAEYYGWIQFYGYHARVITNGDDDISDGDTLILSTTDGTCDSVPSGTASTFKPLGVAVSDDVDGFDIVCGFLDC